MGHGVFFISPLPTPQLRDPDDTVILETAIAANTEVIIISCPANYLLYVIANEVKQSQRPYDCFTSSQ